MPLVSLGSSLRSENIICHQIFLIRQQLAQCKESLVLSFGSSPSLAESALPLLGLGVSLFGKGVQQVSPHLRSGEKRVSMGSECCVRLREG